MAMEIIPPSQQAMPAQAVPKRTIRRIIAHVMKKAGRGELFVESMGKKMPYQNYLAIQLWDAITTGEFLFADGTHMKIEAFKDWLDLVKFVAQHLDGPAVNEQNFIGINVYKVYQGIDESKV